MDFNSYPLHFIDEKPGSVRLLDQSHSTRKEEWEIKLKRGTPPGCTLVSRPQSANSSVVRCKQLGLGFLCSRWQLCIDISLSRWPLRSTFLCILPGVLLSSHTWLWPQPCATSSFCVPDEPLEDKHCAQAEKTPTGTKGTEERWVQRYLSFLVWV